MNVLTSFKINAQKAQSTNFEPNLLSHLLHINICNNFFEFAELTFLQTKGTAKGAAFSPTIANIYMSILLREFLSTTPEKPLYLKRYIDDIFILWPEKPNLTIFYQQIKSYHPQIKFTIAQSTTSVNFLDITVYKDKTFEKTGKLSVMTYQKDQNLFQYLHFKSNHPKSTLKGLIIGEAIRYIRTNSKKEKYEEQLSKFIQRLTTV